MKIAIILIVVVLVSVTAWLLYRRSQPKIGEIAPAHVLQKKYGLYAENRPEIRLDPGKVPEGLRSLIPQAEKWGIGDDIIRGDLVDQSTPEERQKLHDALYGSYEEITAWLNSFGDKPMSEEAAAFMYMQEALEEMGSYILDEKNKAKESTQQ